MKKAWSLKKNAEAVSPVIATILMVAITVVLAAVLYVMVLGFGGTSSQTPTSSISKVTPAPSYGVKYQFAPFSKDTAWSDVTILLQDGSGNTASFATVTENLDNGTTAKYNFASTSLGSLTVFCNVTDLAGNGYVNSGDYFTFTTPSSATFSASVTYTARIMHDPTAAEVCSASFQGT